MYRNEKADTKGIQCKGTALAKHFKNKLERSKSRKSLASVLVNRDYDEHDDQPTYGRYHGWVS